VLIGSCQLLLAACATPQQGEPGLAPLQRDEAPGEVISSRWSTAPVVIDGKGQEWREQALRAFPALGLSVGLRNDADALYVIVVTRSPRLARALSDELTLWVDGAGTRHKRYGVGIPDDSRGGALRIKNRQWLESLDPAERLRVEAQLRAEERIAVTRPGRGTTVGRNGEAGAALASGQQDGLFCFELKLPRRWTEGAASAPALGLELSVPVRRPGKGRGGGGGVSLGRKGGGRGGVRGGGMRGGGMRGGGRQRGGMGGMGGRGGQMGSGRGAHSKGQRGVGPAGKGVVRLEKRELWVKVRLARRPGF
jgi:hypothetical protein